MEDLNSNTAKSFLTFLLILLVLNSFADNYFWIGNSGNWSDINHWSTTSGGTILHNTPPSADDDVYFDNKSFTTSGQTIWINTENAVCKTLDFTNVSNNPVFQNSSSVNFKIFGSIIFSSAMQYLYSGTLTFESQQSGNLIKTCGKTILNNIIFDGINGSWSLEDSLVVDANVYLNYGYLDLAGNVLTCNVFSTSGSNPRGINIQNTTVNIMQYWNANSINFNLLSANSTIDIHLSTINPNQLINSGDGSLIYNRVRFLGDGSITNSGVYVYYDSVQFLSAGSMTGDCSVNFLSFAGPGMVTSSDTLDYVRFMDVGTIDGFHYADSVFFDSLCTIKGSNYIRYSLVKSDANILNSNQIDYIRIGGTTYIEGLNSFHHLFMNRLGILVQNNYARYAYFNCDGQFKGSNTFDTLVFSSGFEYLFDYGTIQTVNKEWILPGTCERPIFMTSTYNGKKATIHSTNCTVSGSHLSLRDIHATGNIPFTAIQSVDLGNNADWNIDIMAVRDLYWVNGNGNWDESSHWDIIPGGPGGHCPPTERDNVFINGSSSSPGDSIIINSTKAVCWDMDWTGAANPVFYCPDTNELKIYGSLKFTEAMTLSVLGETHFEDTLGLKTVLMKNQSFPSVVKFQGTHGDWTLLDEFSCDTTVFHERGTVSTKGSNLLCEYYSSVDTNYRTLYLHSDTVKLYNDGIAWNLNALNYELHADSSVITTSGEAAIIRNTNHERLIFHNVHQYGTAASIVNDAYTVFNLVTHQSPSSLIINNCTIDTSIMYGTSSSIIGNDTIKTAIFYSDDGLLLGGNIVEIAYYYGSGTIRGWNRVDTALYFSYGTIDIKNEIDTTIIYDEALIRGGNKIRTASLKERGSFYGNNEFDDLYFTPSKKYIFEHDSTQTINNKWVVGGTCNTPTWLVSDEIGQKANIEKLNTGVDTDFLIVRDIKAMGVIPFIADNSADLGNNENWQIANSEPKALYWVGGTGNWSDSLHWASESGGVSTYCIANPNDDVYFDKNSFLALNDTVYIDYDYATCRSMSWQGSSDFKPVFAGPEENNLYIFGNLLFNDSMAVEYLGDTYFESGVEGRTIESRGQSFKGDVIFEGRNGGWNLIDEFQTEYDLIFTHGMLNTNDLDIYCANFNSPDSNLRELKMNESEIFVGGYWNLQARNLTFDGDSSIINTMDMTTSDGDLIVYNNVNIGLYPDIAGGSGYVLNDSVYCRYNNILFYGEGGGEIRGDCTIDTTIFHQGAGSVYDSDSINFSHFKGVGYLIGGEHQVKSAIFEGDGTISGYCHIHSAIFNSNAHINDSNTIDTTIIYEDGWIQGTNTFNSNVVIFGSGYIQTENLFNRPVEIFDQGGISGNNLMKDNLIIHGNANIFGTNYINDALLLDWGNLGGTNLFDTLSFTPGNTYTLVSNQTQTVKDRFNIRGNNCFPIILKSSSNGNQADINVNNEIVTGDFINMKDIHAGGTSLFYAGGHSTNISNNTGWIWDNAPGYIYGLGFDHANLCPGDTILLSTENFNGNPDTQYQWSDGSTGLTFEVSQPGIYEVTVIYSDSCSVPGQVVVDLIPLPEIDLGADKEICEGESVTFIPGENYTSYLWSTGSSEPSIPASISDNYWLEVTGENGCKNKDTIYLEVLAAPVIELGSDQIIHNEEYLTLYAGYPADSYFWSTGDTMQTINAYGIEGGNVYWVVVAYKGCSSSDTIVIDEYPSCLAELPTAFSPNGDILNDELEIFTSGLQILDFKLFNRYGELVFESTDPTGSQKWDGNFKNQKLDMEVFTYYLKAICLDGYLIEKKGNVTLLR